MGGRYNYTPFIIIIIICFRYLGPAAVGPVPLLPEGDRQSIESGSRDSDDPSGLFTTYWITFHGMLLPFLYNYVQQYMAIFPAMFAGIALTDIAAGIGQIRKKKTEPVIQEENE